MRAARQRYIADLDWLRAGADGLAEFIDAGPGQTKSRPGQEKKGDDPMTENSKITNALA
jgi:hypothetical protein